MEYLLKKICMAMSVEFNCVELEDFLSQDTVQQSGITVWGFLELMNSGKITRGIDKDIISMAIEEVYREIVGDVLKEVRTICCLVFGSWLVLREDDVTVGTPAGLPVEERAAEEELEGALVHLKAQLLVLLHRGGSQGLPGEHRSGRELFCGGTTQRFPPPWHQ